MEIVTISSQAEAMQPLGAIAAAGGALTGIYVAAALTLRARLTLRAGLTSRVATLPARWAGRRPHLSLPSLGRAALGVTASLVPAPWIETDARPLLSPRFATSEYPLPPRSLVRAGEGSQRTTRTHDRVTHPAIHGVAREAPAQPLFPPAGSRNGWGAVGGPPRSFHDPDQDAIRRGISDLRRDRRAAQARRLRGSTDRTAHFSHYAVLPGDTLWGIAAKVLRTDDLRAIARYWPRIHQENRDVIGANPDLLRPGMVLSLPPVAHS